MVKSKAEREAARRARLERDEHETRRRQMTAAGVENWDPRTAMGQRRYEVVTLGPKLRVSVNNFTNCFKSRSDRTPVRVLTWSYLESHFFHAYTGQIPPAQLEPGVDCSGSKSVAEDQLQALRDDAALAQELGRYMHWLLVQIVYHQAGYKELERQGHGGEKLVAGMFKRAIDLTAEFWKVGKA